MTTPPSSRDAVQAQPSQYLSSEQNARILALNASRAVIHQRGGSGALASAAITVDPIDLVSVARFIMTGEDPYTAYTREVVDDGPRPLFVLEGDDKSGDG